MHYKIKAIDSTRSVVSQLFQAVDSRDAERQARAQGLIVLHVSPINHWISWRARSKNFPLTLFSQELLALLRAGLSLVEAIEALAEKEHGNAQGVLTQVVHTLYEGRTFSQALENQPAVFPDLFISLMRASERTGNLPEALSRYIAYRTQMDRVRKKIINASLYPLLLMLVGGLVTLFLLVYVVPRFSLVYADMGENLPLLSRLLLSWGQLLSAYGAELVGGFFALILLVVYGLSQFRWRSWLSQRTNAMPVLGERIRTYQLARFYRSLGMLLQGGIPLVKALNMASGLLPAGLQPQLSQATSATREGLPLSQALSREGLTTSIALRLIRIGERSGQLGEMFNHVADFHDDELGQWMEGFSRLFEPILMTFIGLMIGTIVVLMYMPIFELAGSLQ